MFDQTSALGRVLGFGGGIAVLGTLALILGVGPADAQLTGGARVYFEKAAAISATVGTAMEWAMMPGSAELISGKAPSTRKPS